MLQRTKSFRSYSKNSAHLKIWEHLLYCIDQSEHDTSHTQLSDYFFEEQKNFHIISKKHYEQQKFQPLWDMMCSSLDNLVKNLFYQVVTPIGLFLVTIPSEFSCAFYRRTKTDCDNNNLSFPISSNLGDRLRSFGRT